MIPLSDYNVWRNNTKRPYVTWIIIALCVIVFIYQVTLSLSPSGYRDSTDNSISKDDIFIYEYGMVPARVIGRELPQDFPVSPVIPLLTLITSIFLHGGWTHIGFNMMFLWVFGDNIERAFGWFGYLAFYLVGGVAANLAHMAFSLSGDSALTPTIGASGAIAAVMGAYLALFPTARIRTLVMFFFITFTDIAAYWFLLIWFGLQIFGLLGGQQGVAIWAHIGGFVFGWAVGFVYLRFTRPNAPPPWQPLVGRRGIKREPERLEEEKYDIWKR